MGSIYDFEEGSKAKTRDVFAYLLIIQESLWTVKIWRLRGSISQVYYICDFCIDRVRRRNRLAF